MYQEDPELAIDRGVLGATKDRDSDRLSST
jgi:hypothetical protein